MSTKRQELKAIWEATEFLVRDEDLDIIGEADNETNLKASLNEAVEDTDIRVGDTRTIFVYKLHKVYQITTPKVMVQLQEIK